MIKTIMPWLGVLHFFILTLGAAGDDFSAAGEKSLKAVELLKRESSQAEGVRILSELAATGFAPAMHLKGMMLLDGSHGVERDMKLGFRLVKESAELEYVPAMVDLSQCYSAAKGIGENPRLSFEWAKKASVFASPHAWSILGIFYEEGYGVAADLSQAVIWYKKSAGAGHPFGQWYYGVLLQGGKGVEMDEALAVKYFRAAAVQRLAESQYSMGVSFLKGYGVDVSIPEGTAWITIAAEGGHKEAQAFLNKINYPALPAQLRQQVSNRVTTLKAEIAATPITRDGPEPWSSPRRNPGADLPGKPLKWTGTGFLITSQGHIVTNQHVAPAGSEIQVITRFGAFAAKVLKTDEQNDLSLLKVDGTFIPVALSPSDKVRLGATVATIGFPNTDMQGFSPKLTKGEVSSLAGLRDDPRYFQISVPVQPGNSGGALFDVSGNVIGVVTAKISQKAAIAKTGTIAENVNFAVKSSHLLSFLESTPEVFSQLPKASRGSPGFEDIVAEVEKSAVLILAY
jgi:S1-C subfamily serine protease